jgi:hypothetical protein
MPTLRWGAILCIGRGASLGLVPAEASWRNGYAEDCKSFHPGSIPGEASKAGASRTVPCANGKLIYDAAKWNLLAPW